MPSPPLAEARDSSLRYVRFLDMTRSWPDLYLLHLFPLFSLFVFPFAGSIAYMKRPKQNFPTGYLLGKFIVSKEVCSTPFPLLNDDDQWFLACNLSTRLSASRCSRPGKVNLCGERHQGKIGPGRKSSKVARSPKQNVVFAAPWSDWMVLAVSCQYPSEL